MEWIRDFVAALGDNGTAILIALVSVFVPVMAGVWARESKSDAAKPRLMVEPSCNLGALEISVQALADDLTVIRDRQVKDGTKIDLILERCLGDE